MRRRLLRPLTALCCAMILLGAASCSGPGPLAPPEPDLPVATRLLPLTDPSRVTDPTPDQAGDDAVQGRELPTYMWYPETGDGPYPVVVFSHGFNSRPSEYRDMLARWASAGFVVAAPMFPLTSRGSAGVVEDVANQPADVSFVLTQVLALDETAGDDLAGRIDTGHVAFAGHSAGGITTIALLSGCCADDRATAAIVLAGTTAGFEPDFVDSGVPTLFVHGTDDERIPLTDGEDAYDAAPDPKAFVELVGGTHTSPYSNTAEDRHRAVVLDVTTDFLRWAVGDEANAVNNLRADADQKDLSELTDDQLTR